MRLLLFFIVIFLSFNISISGEQYCATDVVPQASFPLLPTTGTIKAVIIYVKFSDDTIDSSPDTDQWPGTLNTLPSWAPSTMDTAASSTYNNPSISGYFNEMSMDTFNLIGKVCPVLFVPANPSTYYLKSSGRNISYLTADAINFADSYIDYSNFDNYDPEDIDNDNVLNEPDGTVDMIIICIRSLKGGGKYYGFPQQGYASLTGAYSTFYSGGSLSTSMVRIAMRLPFFDTNSALVLSAL